MSVFWKGRLGYALGSHMNMYVLENPHRDRMYYVYYRLLCGVPNQSKRPSLHNWFGYPIISFEETRRPVLPNFRGRKQLEQTPNAEPSDRSSTCPLCSTPPELAAPAG